MAKSSFGKAGTLIKEALKEFINEDDPFTLAGALAYFTIFSIPPILIILISTVGFIAGEQMAKQELYTQIHALWGKQGVELIRNVVDNYAINEQNLFQKILSIAVLVFSSTSFFAVVQGALNKIWGVRPKPKNDLLKMIWDRFLSFMVVLIVGLLLILSFVLESVLISVRNNFDQLIPGISPILFGVAGYLLSFLLLVLMFAIIYKLLPDAVVSWKVVWAGATITAFLFTLGRLAISFYLTQSSPSDAFGIAGALVLILLWIFYSAIILFL